MPAPLFAGFFQRCLLAAGLACLPFSAVHAQAFKASAGRVEDSFAATALTAPATLPSHIDGWIARLHHAAKSRSYVGTLVVSSADGAMSSARITHACSGEKQLERIESLTGVPRITYRWGHEISIFLPQARILHRGHLDTGARFPSLDLVPGTAVADFYRAVYQGTDRVAGLAADVVWFKPSDSLRFGYRIWSERETGLVLKMQTLQDNGGVIEQVAFSEVDLQAVVPLAPMRRHMQATRGYQVVDVPLHKTSAVDHGWLLHASVPGFVPVHCYSHSASPASGSPSNATLQCTFSDGLASVSLFIESYRQIGNGAGIGTAQRTGGRWSMGATHTLAQRAGPDGWLTAVGEVPPGTLLRFAQGLERVQ